MVAEHPEQRAGLVQDGYLLVGQEVVGACVPDIAMGQVGGNQGGVSGFVELERALFAIVYENSAFVHRVVGVRVPETQKGSERFSDENGRVLPENSSERDESH